MDSQVSVTFIASVLSAAMFGVLAGLPPSSIFHVTGASFWAVVVALCIAMPAIGYGVLRLKPDARDLAWGIGLSPFPGTLAFLLGALWVAIA
ncbi:hypothetical protein BKG59_22440 [Mycobacteroides chelonae]|nr:hypothetical protein BKG63_07460 [Mycobacteroides chelonae]OHT99875.1 hypothetical protein BKG72_05775 [Mycobacteroides chelonae]OLT86561.1 hypothetical protein BKG59_22440 [Mycobacteroides chelonae]